ncbi:hypothetical protein VTJ49DRAFT_5600 [Mycothermus thermophilus]|uniref:Secreted protein n=1 Tax=Humicola insolens TaxID=85995 RepID=A0ABR3V3B4_HUMIN
MHFIKQNLVATAALLALVFPTSVVGQKLGLLEVYTGGQWSCGPVTSGLQIVSFGDTHREPSVECSDADWTVVSRGPRGPDANMDGCKEGVYDGGYRVCITKYGANIHNDKGQHQRCHTDKTNLSACMYKDFYQCMINKIRRLTCDGVWHNDA